MPFSFGFLIPAVQGDAELPRGNDLRVPRKVAVGVLTAAGLSDLFSDIPLHLWRVTQDGILLSLFTLPWWRGGCCHVPLL